MRYSSLNPAGDNSDALNSDLDSDLNSNLDSNLNLKDATTRTTTYLSR
jgi:hypothetical protein